METCEDLYNQSLESKLYEQILKEATYSWNIDPIDRSWFVSPKGELWNDVSHRLMLKNKFSQEWNELNKREIDDSEIEEIFTNRLIQSGYVKIGELNDFYVIVFDLDNRTKDFIQGFTKSVLQVRDVANSLMTIHQRSNGESIKGTIGEISDDFLFCN